MQARPNIGYVYAEHSVPEGAKVLEQKYCELCGRPFTRRFAPTSPYATRRYKLYSAVGYTEEFASELRRDHGERFCRDCRGRGLQPDIEGQEKYMEQMPGTAQQMRHAPHLPKYDKTLEPVGRATRAHAISVAAPSRARRRATTPRADTLRWHAEVTEAFRLRGHMTAEEIADLIPGCWSPVDAWRRCYSSGLRLRLVGRAPRQPGIRGQGAGIYALAVEAVPLALPGAPEPRLSDGFVRESLENFFGREGA